MFIQENAFENVSWKVATISLGLNVYNMVLAHLQRRSGYQRYMRHIQQKICSLCGLKLFALDIFCEEH